MIEPVKNEKKVEYLELIYDLIFVFVIGRNNSLLHNIEGGFFRGGAFAAYVAGTLAVIQIWNFTTYYINIFGRNGAREHISLFINMFLMYFIAEGIASDWADYYIQYHIAWALILINIGVQYLIELRNHRNNKRMLVQIKRMSVPMFAEAVAVLAVMLIYRSSGIELSWLAIAVGIIASFAVGIHSEQVKVDFSHLTERAMLYVVFTFGEMIISLSGYFEGIFNIDSLYFSAMGFLIVAALFLSYETLYDHIVDREQQNSGLSYMLIHIFLIFSLNNITVALEFMRMEEIFLLPKMLFLISSFLLFFICIFLLGKYAKKRCVFNKKFITLMGASAIAFVCAMLIFREYMKLNILLTVIYVFSVFMVLHRFGKVQKETTEF